jgi:hypothetical protein
MAPTLQNQDRMIVNKLAYRMGEPQIGDIVMHYYPLKPEKSFVQRVIAGEGDQVRIVDGKVYRNDVVMDDSFVPPDFRSHDDWGPQVIPEGYYFVMGTIATTAPTAVTGASCRRSTSSARCSSAGGPRTRACSDLDAHETANVIERIRRSRSSWSTTCARLSVGSEAADNKRAPSAGIASRVVLQGLVNAKNC